nr:unnamed protein product [Digitaria exilis]
MAKGPSQTNAPAIRTAGRHNAKQNRAITLPETQQAFD